MNKKIDVSILIPLHYVDDTVKELLTKAVESVKKQEIEVSDILLIVPDILADDEFLNGLDINFIINPDHEKLDFCSQVNYGVSQIKSKYFSILEFDDEYSKTYFKNVDEYLKAYSDVKTFLPITVLVNTQNQALGYINEATWAQGFSEVIGIMDMASLLQYDNFMISGAIIDKESFEEIGGLKGDIKLYFNYEYLLRYIHNDFKTMIIPKLGYKHLIERDNSLFKSYTHPITGIKQEEAVFFKSVAKKEYFFNPNVIKRTIKYTPTIA